MGLTFSYFIVDAFTDQPFKGNPAAVVLMESQRDESWLQSVASEMNLSETAFVDVSNGHTAGELPLRWFTPEAEVALCGHATLAAVNVLGTNCVFSTKSGLLPCTINDGWIKMDFPADMPDEVTEDAGVDFALAGAQPISIAQGVSDTLVELASEQDVLDYEPNFEALRKVRSRGVIITARSSRPDFDFVSRCFYPNVGVPEDPVTGSAHTTLALWWGKRLNKTELKAIQASKRSGVVRMNVEGTRVHLFGQAVTVAEGKLRA